MTQPDDAVPRNVIQMAPAALRAMVAHAYACYPEEACGLLIGDPAGTAIESFVACRNIAASARVYELDPREHLRVERAAEDQGRAVIGVMHSHTHSEPYPSPTDVAQAPDPSWHYVITGLARDAPETRSYHIEGGVITEEPIRVHDIGSSGRQGGREG